MVGSIAANLHEGSRSEYLAQFVFSAFGTAIPVSYQEDSGLDIYCTLTERIGQRAWPRAYYAVQVKSELKSWIFADSESVRWLIEHPLPIFLCVVQKSDARILIYQTSPRFAAWAQPTHPSKLRLIPGIERKAETIDWKSGDEFHLAAPILDFTIEEVLQDDGREHVARVLKYWIDFDLENLVRLKSGIHRFRVPADYETNSTYSTGVAMIQTSPFQPQSVPVAETRLQDLLGTFTSHYYQERDMTSAAICAMALRHLAPALQGFPQDVAFHAALNELFGTTGQGVWGACDSLLKLAKDAVAEKTGETGPQSSPA